VKIIYRFAFWPSSDSQETTKAIEKRKDPSLRWFFMPLDCLIHQQISNPLTKRFQHNIRELKNDRSRFVLPQ
jgi:hypothetical protein